MLLGASAHSLLCSKQNNARRFQQRRLLAAPRVVDAAGSLRLARQPVVAAAAAASGAAPAARQTVPHHSSTAAPHQQHSASHAAHDEAAARLSTGAAVDSLTTAAAAVGDAAADVHAAAEAVHEAGTQLQPEESEYTEVEEQVFVVEEPVDFRTWVTTSNVGRGLLLGLGAFLGATLAVTLYRTYNKFTSTRAQRMRTIDKNKALVEALSLYLPSNRSGLTPNVAAGIKRKSGYSSVEVFRKYLWYLLRERSFDPDAVQDMVQLKLALGLSDEEVAEALRERAQRIYEKFGTLMLDTSGLTDAGVERKATCRALVSKLLYLTEQQPLVAEGSAAFATTDLRTIFGATDEDLSKLRIESLVEVDADTLTRLMATQSASDSASSSMDEPASAADGSSSGTGGSSSSSTGGGQQ